MDSKFKILVDKATEMSKHAGDSGFVGRSILALIKEINEEYAKVKNTPILQLMHDTMSPVNTIKGSVKTIKSGTLTPEETLKLLNAIDERADRLNEAIDSFYIKENPQSINDKAIKWFDNLSSYHREQIRIKYSLNGSTLKIIDETLCEIYIKEFKI